MTCLTDPCEPSAHAADEGCPAPGAVRAAAPAEAAVTPSARATAAGTANVLEKPLLPTIRSSQWHPAWPRAVAAHPLWWPVCKKRSYQEQSQVPGGRRFA